MTPSPPPRPPASRVIGDPHDVSDPRALMALAHPVRMGIIELLTVNGPMTATGLADLLDETPANCSWHLRKLAEHGFVQESGGGRGRQRPWEVTRIGFRFSEDDASPAQREARSTLNRVLVQRFTDRYLAASRLVAQEGGEWFAASGSLETALWLTPEEATRIGAQVNALLEPFNDRFADPTARPEGARLCEAVGWLVPVDGVGLLVDGQR